MSNVAHLTITRHQPYFDHMESSYEPLKDSFTRTFGEGGRLVVVRSPGRVNLIGEHTDYNDGFVFPLAIQPQVSFVCRGREDGLVRVTSTAFPDEMVEFSIQTAITKAQPTWANYVRGVASELKKAGIPLIGMDVQLSNTLPVGGGLSSSAAIEVGTALCFLALAGLEMDVARLALLCQQAEHNFADVPCGIMDQMIVSSARQGHATLYDCRQGTRVYVPLNSQELRVVIVNTMVKHELTGSEYADRRNQCQMGVAHFARANPKIKALRDVSLAQLESAKGELSDLIYRRCRHVVSENLRTTEAATALSNHQYERTGALMVQSHNSLRDDYEVSVPELDYLVEQAMQIKGVYGARMTGGGFGGCIVALVQPRSVDELTNRLEQKYQDRFGIQPTAFVTTATAGASRVE